MKRVEPGLGMGVSVSLPEEQQETYRQLIQPFADGPLKLTVYSLA